MARDDVFSLSNSRSWVVISVMLCVLLFAGQIYGYNSMELVLKREGFHVTGIDEDGTVHFDTEALALIISVALMVSSASAALAGMLADWLGLTFIMASAGVMQVTACLCIAFATSSRPWLLNVGFASFAYAGMATILCGFKTSVAFEKHASIIVAVTTSLFDLSGIVFSCMNELSKAGFSLKSLMLGYAVLSALGFGVVVCLYLAHPQDGLGPCCRAATEVPEHALLTDPCVSPSNQSYGSQASTASHRGTPSTPYTPPTGSVQVSKPWMKEGAEVPVKERPWIQQLQTYEFAFISAFSIVNMVRSPLFLGMIQDSMQDLGTQEQVDEISTIIGWAVPGGCVFCLLSIYLMEHCGFLLTATFVCAAGTLYGALTCIPVLGAQLAATFVYSSFRATLFSFASGFMVDAFGGGNLGKMTGVVYTTAGFLALIQIPLTSLAVDQLDGNFQPINIGLTAVMVIPIVATLLGSWVIPSLSPSQQKRPWPCCTGPATSRSASAAPSPSPSHAYQRLDSPQQRPSFIAGSPAPVATEPGV